MVQRRLLPLPDRATVYELTAYGRELEPVLMALGRWGTLSMTRLPADVATRSRWLVAAMLAFHDESRRIARATTWELRLSDGTFSVHADQTRLTVAAGRQVGEALLVLHRRHHTAEAVETGGQTGELQAGKVEDEAAQRLDPVEHDALAAVAVPI